MVTTAHYTPDIIRPERGAGGLVPHETKHVCLQRRCTCESVTRAQPARRDQDSACMVALSAWHRAGPILVVFICSLAQRIRLPRARVREFRAAWLGLSVSRVAINQCVDEAATGSPNGGRQKVTNFRWLANITRLWARVA